MKLNRFETVSGTYIEKISGQSRIGYSLSDSMDFYDIIEHSKKGDYHGSVISFYDYENGKVYEPFSKQRNVSYGHPIYSNHCFWLLQGDYNQGIYTLYRYLPGEIPQMVTQINAADVNPYIYELSVKRFISQARMMILFAIIPNILASSRLQTKA